MKRSGRLLLAVYSLVAGRWSRSCLVLAILNSLFVTIFFGLVVSLENFGAQNLTLATIYLRPSFFRGFHSTLRNFFEHFTYIKYFKRWLPSYVLLLLWPSLLLQLVRSHMRLLLQITRGESVVVGFVFL